MRLIILSFLILLLFSCTKTEVKDSEPPSTKQEAMDIYKDALSSMEEGQYLIASEKFENILDESKAFNFIKSPLANAVKILS